jgi:hypothetical protein
MHGILPLFPALFNLGRPLDDDELRAVIAWLVRLAPNAPVRAELVRRLLLTVATTLCDRTAT